MKVFFFEPYALAIPHFETALELVQFHINRNDQVNLYYCSADLNSCEANYKHSLAVCLQCISRRRLGLDVIEGQGKINKANFVNLSKSEWALIHNWKKRFANLDELKAFRYDNIDIGMAVASSLISYRRNPEPDLNADAYLIDRLFKASLKVYLSFKKLLLDDKPDLVYLFNGRFSNIRPVVRLCELRNIRYKIHERGSNKSKYSLSENHLPHEYHAFYKLVEEFWQENGQNPSFKTADTFFQDRRAGKEQAWHSFVGLQKQGQLPENWQPAKRNIVIFNSSEDEFAAIGDTSKRKLFNSQLAGIKIVADLVSSHQEICVHVRMHPNLKGVNNSTVAGLYEIASQNIHVIPPDSSISSYELIDSADLIITFGSTIGIEATYWGKPSVLIGEAFYKDLGSTYNPATIVELENLVLTATKPIDKLGAYKYGFYIANYGIEYNWYNAEGLFKGEFRGERIAPPGWIDKFLRAKPLSAIVNYISRIHADKF